MEATQKKRNSQTEGTVLALMAALLWSTNAPLIKSLSLDATLVAGMRALIAGVVLLPFLRPKKIKWGLPVVSMMVFFTLQSLFIVVALQKTSAAIAVGMQYTAPVWLYPVSYTHLSVQTQHGVRRGCGGDFHQPERRAQVALYDKAQPGRTGEQHLLAWL